MNLNMSLKCFQLNKMPGVSAIHMMELFAMFVWDFFQGAAAEADSSSTPVPRVYVRNTY